GVRSKYEYSTVRPASPGTAGNIHRIGCVVEKTHCPPRRTTRATSAKTTSASLTKGSAPYEEKATSKRFEAKGSWRATARRNVGGGASALSGCSLCRREACSSIPAETSTPVVMAPCSASHREHWPAPQPTSRTCLRATSPRRWTSDS